MPPIFQYFFLSGQSGVTPPYEVNDTLSLTDTIGLNKTISLEVSDSLDFTDTADALSPTKILVDDLHIVQGLGLNQVKNVDLTDTLDFIETLDRIRSFPTIEVSDTIDISDTLINQSVKIRAVSETLDFTETLDKLKSSNFQLDDALTFIDNTHKNVAYARSISDLFVVQTGSITRSIEDTSVTYRDVIVMKSTSYITLQSILSTIVLPDPLFGNTQQNNDALDIKRAVDGTPYTYVKSTKRYKLKYSFELKKSKAIELKAFIDKNYLQQMTLTTWKGDIFFIWIMNNPVTFAAVSRGFECVGDEETYAVSLELEGFKAPV